jgi:phosphatidylethanolamine/phosphatidyl-N-methylethanolamine N-methyltransferase
MAQESLMSINDKAVPVPSHFLPHRDAAKLNRHRRLRNAATNRDGDMAVFLGSWLKAPHRIGALAPSSRFLARAMATQVDVGRPEFVVELGGGTGSVTKALLDAGVPPSRLIVVERDERLYKLLRRRFPQLRVVQGDATDLVALLKPLGIRAASAVVSSLPLVSMSKRMRGQIVDQAFYLLGEAGRFVQYTYSLSSPVAVRELGLRGRVAARVWLNFPPASVWNYRRIPAAA